MARQAAGEHHGDRRLVWLNRLNGERAAVEAALSWAVEHEPELALELMASLWWWWCDRPAEALPWYRRTLIGSSGRAASDGRLQATWVR